MRYPSMGSNKRNAVSVPALSGGVNLNDALNLVDDNQMTDCKNVWYKDGILQTRPGLGVSYVITEDSVENINNEFSYYSVELEQFIDGVKPHIFVIKETRANKSGIMRVQIFSNDYSRDFHIKQEFGVMFETEMFYAGKKTLTNGKGIYMLASENDGTNSLYEITETDSVIQLTKLGPDDLYSPAVYINGKSAGYSNLVADTETAYAPASFFEGYSAFSDAWADFCFTTDYEGAYFELPVCFNNCYLKIEYTQPSTGAVFKSDSFIIKNKSDLNYEEVFIIDGLSVFVTTNVILNYVFFWIKDSTMNTGYNGYAFEDSLGVLANNLKIKIRPITPAKTNLFGMKFGTWFGGAASGINGGTRFFVSGSEENPNLLMWSDLNNPTYFPENNYAYVGEKTQGITALKKQSNMLVIFKENEIFYTTYAEGETYSAEDVIAGKVVDVTTMSATFPMTHIHSNIGCNIPKSVQLCGDRLVWASKDRHVYMLKSANQYSTVNVLPVSASIDNALKNITDDEVEKAKSCTYDGHYLLSFGSKTFVLDYDYYYFNALPSYSDSKKSQRKMVWYLWEFAVETNDYETYVSSGDNCSVLGISIGDQQSEKYLVYICKSKFELSGYDYGYKIIESVIQTKMFDFGAMERFKSIEQLYIGFGKDEGTVSVEYLTERGTVDRGSFDLIDTAEENSPQFIKTKRFLPGIKRALRFGIRLTSKGRIAVDGILIKYKYLGVTR